MQNEHKKDWNKVVMTPPGSGMSVIAHEVALGGTMVVLDKGSSAEGMAAAIRQQEAEQTQRVMRIGRKRNDGPVVQTKAEPYYRQFAKRR